MAGDSRLSARFGADTNDFKNGIRQIQTEIKVLETGFRANTASLGDWSKTATGLEERIKSLTGQIALQQEKVAALSVDYDRLVTAKGKESIEAQNALIRLNNETAALGKMQSELGSTKTSLDGMGKESQTAGGEVETLGKKEDTTSTATDKLKEKSGGLGAALKTAGIAVAGLATAVAGVGAGIGKMVLNTAESSKNLEVMSQKTGLSTDKLQELQYIADQTGTDMDTMTGSMSKLVKSMSGVQTQTDKAGAALDNMTLGEKAQNFQNLGIAVTDSNGQFRSATDVYKDAVKALAGISNPVDRDLVSMSLFGKTANQVSAKDLPSLEKSMNDANNQFGDFNIKQSQLENSGNAVGDAFDKLGVKVTDSNGNLRDSRVVWQEAIDALGKIPDETERDSVSMAIFGKKAQELEPLTKAGAAGMADMTQQAHDMGAVLDTESVSSAANFEDQLDSLKAGLTGTVETVSMDFLPAFSSLASKGGGYLKTFAGIVKSSGGDMGKLTSGVAGLVQTIITDIAKQAPQLLKAGLAILQGIVKAIIGALPTLMPAVISMLMMLVTFIVQNIPMILQAGIQILLALITGITGALPQLIPAVVLIIPQIIETLIANLPLLIQASILLLIALAQGLIAAIPVLIPEIPKIVTAILNALVQAAPMLFVAALQLLVMLAQGIVDNLPKLIESAGKIILTLVEAMTGLSPQMLDAGVKIVEGIWQGIQSQAAAFAKQVSDFFTGIVDGVKNLLGIHSPSAVFANIGLNMASGLGTGFTRQFKQIEKTISGAVGNMKVGNVNLNAAAGTSAGGARPALNMGGIHIQIAGNGDPNAVAQAAQLGVTRALRAMGVN